MSITVGIISFLIANLVGLVQKVLLVQALTIQKDKSLRKKKLQKLSDG